MKHILYLFALCLVLSCTQKESKKDITDFENDPRLSESTKKEIRDSNERKKWSFEKWEVYYLSLKNKPKPLEAFYFLDDLVLRSIDEKRWDKTEVYSNEYLRMAESFKSDWNYGNAIFHGNLGISHVAFNKKLDSKSADNYLLAASKTPGSPQLVSFGPFNEPSIRSFLQELAKKGHKDTLLEFAENCKKFVTRVYNKESTQEQRANSDEVEKWNFAALEHFEQQIRENETPDFKK